MREFLIIFEQIPEYLTIYRLSTTDLEIIKKLESIHNQYIGLQSCTRKMEKIICELESIEGILKVFDNTERSNPPRLLTYDLTIIVTGQVL